VEKKKAGWGNKRSATPLSVEELLRKKKEADEAAAKVRDNMFLLFARGFSNLPKDSRVLLIYKGGFTSI
jgi:hypothetical protein